MTTNKPGAFSPKKQQFALKTKALSHPARIAILNILGKKSCTCNELVEKLPLSQSTVSQHLKELKNCNLIAMTTVKTSSVYALNKKDLKKLKKKFNKFLTPLTKKEKKGNLPG